MGNVYPSRSTEPKGEDVEHEVVKRYRVNISTSVKGIKTYDCTVDIVGADMAEVLKASDELVKALDSRYPPPIEAK